jgi:nitrite reductase/ring-hydroxylating ferredoxin subunit
MREPADEWRERHDAPAPGTELCTLDDLAHDVPRVFTFGTAWNAFEMIVVRTADGTHAYVNVCAHQALPLNIGARVRIADQRFLCDHHHAEFRFSDGRCVAGVCEGLSLSRIPLEVRDGRVLIA